jgi:hypothetical protein
VPPANAFAGFVNALFMDGIVGGFPCGGPGEQCDDANRPYYRPGGSVTRQQMARFSDLGRRHVTGNWTGITDQYGIFSAYNTDYSVATNTGVYGVGSRGVWGESHSSGSNTGAAGYFYNHGGSTAYQYGVYALTSSGAAVYGESQGTAVGDAGARFVGYTGAVITGHGATQSAAGDGLDVGGAGGLYNAIYSTQPAGSTNYTLYGQAHIHGSNISAAEYELEAVYNGAKTLSLGSVVALDPDNAQGGPLGVVAAGPDNADASVGVVSYRLDSTQVGGEAKTYIDATATEVRPGDRVYITFAGRVKMHLAEAAPVGKRVAVGADGAAMVAHAGDGREPFGKVASRPATDGTVDVIVNFK